MNGMHFSLGQIVEVLVNDTTTEARVFGFEFAWWNKNPDWLYHITIDAYAFDLQVMQQTLLDGCNIVTNGNSAKVMPNEKVKAK
jgi:hypothetical protein